MSANLTALLSALGVQDPDTIAAAILSDAPADEAVQSVLKGAQQYARPFIEGEYNERMKTERGQWKGKYMKEALLKANKTFGSVLTNKEIDDILNDPANEGQSIDAALTALKEKASDKSGMPEVELQRMLDTANAKIAEFEARIPEIESAAERKARETIEQFKRDGVVTTELMKALNDKVDNPGKVAELIKAQLERSAVIRLKDDGTIGLYDPKNPDSPLKKNETTLQTFDGLVVDTVDYYGLTKKSNGTTRQPLPAAGGGPAEPTAPKNGATGLEAKLAQVAAATA